MKQIIINILCILLEYYYIIVLGFITGCLIAATINHINKQPSNYTTIKQYSDFNISIEACKPY